MEKVIAIDGKYFYAGIVICTEKRIVIKAAPIIKYMIGWNGLQVKNYCERKKFKIINHEN